MAEAHTAIPDSARLLDAIGAAVIVTDPEGRIVYWNRAATRIYGWSAAEVVGRSILDVTPADAYVPEAGSIMDLLRSGKTWSGEFQVRRRDGTTFEAAVTDTPVFDEAGDLSAIIGVSLDSSKSRQAREDLGRLAAIVSSSADAIIGLSLQGAVISWNAAAEAMFGCTPEEAIGRPFDSFRVQCKNAGLEKLLEQARRGMSSLGVEMTARRGDGREFPISTTLSPVRIDGKGIVGISAIVRDVSEQKTLEAALEWAASHDALTALPNRLLLEARIEEALEQAEETSAPPAVLLLDIDSFKAVNDSFGHAAGDEALMHVSRRLVSLIAREQTLARLGGDEFVLLMPRASRVAAVRLAQRMLEALREPFTVAGHEIALHASIGIALAQRGDKPGDLLRQADVAMYAAKERAGESYWLYEPRLLEEALTRLQIASGLKGAVARGEMYLLYQPVVGIATGRLLGVEALLRWQHPLLGTLPPESFIAAAEDTGTIVELGQFALNEAMRQLSRWRELEPALFVSLNVSTLQLRDARLRRQVLRLLSEYSLPPDSLVIEVTEGRLMTSAPEATRELALLRRAGVRVALDDFGTGYSSLASLARLPVDIVKTDCSFLAGSGTSARERALIAAVLSLIEAAGLEPIVEGIETPAQRELVSGLGVRAGQGFLFSTPLPAQDVGRLLSASGALPDHPATANAA